MVMDRPAGGVAPGGVIAAVGGACQEAADHLMTGGRRCASVWLERGGRLRCVTGAGTGGAGAGSAGLADARGGAESAGVADAGGGAGGAALHGDSGPAEAGGGA